MNVQKSKQIVQKVIEQERKKTGLSTKVLPVTTLENLSYILKKEILEIRKRPFQEKKEFFHLNFKSKVGAYYDDKEDIIKIFLTNIQKNKELSPNSLYYLVNLLVMTYHEWNHKMYYDKIKKETKLTLPYFIYLIEEKSHEQFHLYENYREEFYVEILAERYSYQQTNDILKKYPNLYKKIEPYLNIFLLYFEIMYINYDIERFLNKIDQQNPNLVITLDGKSINKDLILNNHWHPEELETKSTILSSKSFLEKLEYKTLDTKELQILLSSLLESLTTEEQRQQENQKLKIQLEKLQKQYPHYLEQLNTVEGLLLKKVIRNHRKIKYLKIQIQEIQQELRKKEKHLKTRRKIQ